ncbi:hypothetical protein B0H10DRAFT_2120656 [Mycena sp. CBHHK59/15]|nr:hypothetical protein B0H10DRAFT_2120656 [Mycena sp. CBHHK59/15]
MATRKTKTQAVTNSTVESSLSSDYSSLSLLGAPVTIEEFTRLYHGPLADALHFLSEHIVGRTEVSEKRNTILRSQQARSKSNLKQPDTARSDVEKATARLSSGKKSFEVHAAQLSDRQAKLHSAQEQADDLQKKLDHQRRLELLLGVLESKQNFRMKRMEEMTRLIENLKKEFVQENKQAPPITYLQNTSLETKAPRISSTRDSLANLHRCSIRISRLLKSWTPSATDGMLRLRGVVAQSLGTNLRHPDTTQTLDRCISFARMRANQKVQLETQHPSFDVRVLDDKRRSNKEKEKNLQGLADLSTALRLLSDNHVTSILNFFEDSSDNLRASLQSEAQLSKGHVEISRLSIIAEKLVNPSAESFATQVARVCQMHGNVAVRSILEEVERVIKHSLRRRTLVDLARLPQPVVADGAVIDDYRRATHVAYDRVTKLLTRKAEKAIMGRSLANDVEALLRESRLVLGLLAKD